MKKKRTELKIIIVSKEELKDQITKLYDIATNMICTGNLKIEFSIDNLTYIEIGLSE
jgi:hypothetical protein